jgi:competence protein ComEC
MLAVVAGALMAGLVWGAFARSTGNDLSLVPVLAGTLLFLVGAHVTTRPRRWVVALVALASAAAGIGLAPRAEAPGEAGVWHVEGSVERCDAGACLVRVEAMGPIGSASVPRRTRAIVHGLAREAGDVVALDAELRPRARFRNPSPHPDWPQTTPIEWSGRARASTLRARPPRGLAAIVVSIRSRIRHGLEDTLDEPARGIAIALVLGDESAVDVDAAAEVRSAGLTHVLAVSGMHVTIVVGAILFALLRALRVRLIASWIDPARLAHGLAVPFALFYADVAGGAPSAWRAAVTAAIAWCVRASGRRPDPIATAALAVIVLAAIDPSSAVRPAFMLSIAATAAVIDLPTEASLASLARASVRACIATAPIVAWCFDGVPIVGVVANVLLLPIVAALVLPLATVHAAIAAIASPLAAPTAAFLEIAARGFVGACDALGAIDVGRDLPPWSAAEGALATLLALGLIVARDTRVRVAFIVVAALAIVGAEMHLRATESAPGVLRITFLDVSQGDAALIDLPDGSLTLVDAGGSFDGGSDPGARVIVPLLRARRRTRIDRLVVTHPHPDHYGGVASVVRRFAIGEVWDSGQADAEDPHGVWASLLHGLAHTSRVLHPTDLCDRPREHGGARIEVLWPCPSFDPGWDANDNSIVLRITYGARTFVLMGDAEAHAEHALLARGLQGPIDVLKVGHHGSRTSSTEALLGALSPRVAIVSAGVGNRFGHPHAEVIDRLTAHEAAVFRTDRDGGIVATSDGRALTIDSWSGRRSGQ